MYSVRSKDSQGMKAQQMQKRSVSPQKPHSMLVGKIYNNPITSSVTGYYSYAKNSNRVFNYSLGLAESTLKWMSSPMVRRLDDYASWLEGELGKLTTSLYLQPKTVDDIYLNVRFLLDIVSHLASNTLSFSKDKLSKFSARDLVTESMRLTAKYNNREALIGFLRGDLVSEIHNMSDIIVQYLEQINAKAVEEEYAVIGRVVLTLEQGLKRVLDALPEAKKLLEEAKEKVQEAKETLVENVKIPTIQITSPRKSTPKNRMSPARIDTQAIGSVRQVVAQREQTAGPAQHKQFSRWVVVEEAEEEKEDTTEKDEDVKEEEEEIESEAAEAAPIQQSETSGNVTMVSQEEAKEMLEAEVKEEEQKPAPVAAKASKKRIDVSSASEFPALPHHEATKKRTWADIAHEKEEAWQPLPAGNVQIVDLSALDHESRFRFQAPAASQATWQWGLEAKQGEETKQEDEEEPKEDFPALNGNKAKETQDKKASDDTIEETYLDVLQHGSHSKSHANDWHVYHARPVIGHSHRVHVTHTPFIETVATTNHFDALEKLNNLEVRENIEAAEVEDKARLAHEAYLRDHKGMWHHALPASQDKKHHFAHHVTVHKPKSIESLAGSNPFDALREEIDMEEQQHEEELRAETVHVIDSIARERHAARHRLRSAKKLEEAERARRISENKDDDNSESRAADKKAVIEAEEAERKVRLSEYIAKLRANRARENVQRQMDNVEERVLSVSRDEESHHNRELSAQLEEEERTRILAEDKVYRETAAIERAAMKDQVRRLEEEERTRRLKDLEIKNSGELNINLPMVGSPMM